MLFRSDALDEEIARSESTKAKSEETSTSAVPVREESLVQPLKVVAPSRAGTASAAK